MPDGLHGRFLEFGEFTAPGLTGARRVRVWVPDVPPPHPVIYCWDGQNIFDDDGSHAGGWHLHRVLSQRVADGKPAPILVGIDHGGVHRIGDCSPWRIKRHGAGRADASIEFLLNVVKPAVERRFETMGRPGTILCGSSMGGLLSLYGWLRCPGVIGRALIMSPSFWVNPRKLLDEIARSTPLRDARIYLDIGWQEGGPQASRLVRNVAEAIERRGLEHYRVKVRVDPAGAHRESDWQNRFPLALDFLLEE